MDNSSNQTTARNMFKSDKFDPMTIVKGLRENAKLSIELGVEDYEKGTSDSRRYITAIRNIYAGLLLLYKSHLALLSKEQGCCVIRDKVDWSIKDGRVCFEGFVPNGRTLDMEGVLNALKKYGILIKRNELNKIQKYRNKTEHFYDHEQIKKDVVRQYVVTLMKHVRDFTTEIMKLSLEEFFAEAFDVLNDDTDIVLNEQKEREGKLSSLKWFHPMVKEMFLHVSCPKCFGSMLFPLQEGVSAHDVSFVCRSCSNVESYETLMSYYADDLFTENMVNVGTGVAELHPDMLIECPNCAVVSFNPSQNLCFVCGHEGHCSVCGNEITEEDSYSYEEKGLCSHCQWVFEKDD